jgi:hypothetical protein
VLAAQRMQTLRARGNVLAVLAALFVGRFAERNCARENLNPIVLLQRSTNSPP